MEIGQRSPVTGALAVQLCLLSVSKQQVGQRFLLCSFVFLVGLRLRADPPAVHTPTHRSPYDRELGYNGGRTDMGAYGNTMQATPRPPIDQMGITLETQAAAQTGQPGQTLSYTLTLRNSGQITETYALDTTRGDISFQITFIREGRRLHHVVLAPQTEISVTAQVYISPALKPTVISRTIYVQAFNGYVSDELELLAHIPSFQEVNGQVVMEAERGISQIAYTWLPQTILSGYVGTGYISALPDLGRVYTSTGPELRYRLNFTTPGTYHLWMRGYALDGAGDSLYVALDEGPVKLMTGFEPRQWGWINGGQQGFPVTIEVAEMGLHTLSVRIREDGLRLDRILLTTDSGYNPNGDGPPESEIR